MCGCFMKREIRGEKTNGRGWGQGRAPQRWESTEESWGEVGPSISVVLEMCSYYLILKLSYLLQLPPDKANKLNNVVYSSSVALYLGIPEALFWAVYLPQHSRARCGTPPGVRLRCAPWAAKHRVGGRLDTREKLPEWGSALVLLTWLFIWDMVETH